MSDTRRAARGPLAALAFASLLLVTGDALALPMYGARSGRTCDNCHSLPNTWYDPAEIGERKCTLSCNACHVDPNGGGLRTVSGRYFGDATMPMFGAKAPRPLVDRNDDFFESMRTPPRDSPRRARSRPRPGSATRGRRAHPPPTRDG